MLFSTWQFTTWQLSSIGVREQERVSKTAIKSFSNLVSHASDISSLLCIAFIEASHYVQHTLMNIRRQESLGAISEAACHTEYFLLFTASFSNIIERARKAETQ